MKNIVEYKGYTAVQSEYNNHVTIFANDRCVCHMTVCEPLTEVELCTLIDDFIALSARLRNERDAPKKTWPPYMDNPRKSSVNVCAGCVHEATNKGSFPCDKCKRMLRSEHDMFVKKVEG